VPTLLELAATAELAHALSLALELALDAAFPEQPARATEAASTPATAT
jgi:hypothetical protein